ncbi:hypothetical protein [Thermococcus sp.]
MLTLRGSTKEIALSYSLALLLSLPGREEGGQTSPFHFFFFVLLATVLLLAAIRLLGSAFIGKLLFALELLFLTLTFAYLLGSLGLPGYLSLAALPLRILAGERAENASVAVIVGVFAGVVGRGMKPGDAALLLLIMTVYDFLAVFVTGHMRALARALSPGFSEGAYPTGRHALGSGDVALPAVMASSAFSASPLLGLLSALAALTGLLLLFSYSSRRPGVLPALPFIALPQLLVYLLTLSYP